LLLVQEKTFYLALQLLRVNVVLLLAAVQAADVARRRFEVFQQRVLLEDKLCVLLSVLFLCPMLFLQALLQLLNQAVRLFPCLPLSL